MSLEIGFYTSSEYMGIEPFWVNENDLNEPKGQKTKVSGHDLFVVNEVFLR